MGHPRITHRRFMGVPLEFHRSSMGVSYKPGSSSFADGRPNGEPWATSFIKKLTGIPWSTYMGDPCTIIINPRESHIGQPVDQHYSPTGDPRAIIVSIQESYGLPIGVPWANSMIPV